MNIVWVRYFNRSQRDYAVKRLCCNHLPYETSCKYITVHTFIHKLLMKWFDIQCSLQTSRWLNRWDPSRIFFLSVLAHSFLWPQVPVCWELSYLIIFFFCQVANFFNVYFLNYKMRTTHSPNYLDMVFEATNTQSFWVSDEKCQNKEHVILVKT